MDPNDGAPSSEHLTTPTAGPTAEPARADTALSRMPRCCRTAWAGGRPADTVYFCAFFDLSRGPLVLETPEDTLGIVDDMWFRWVTDFGLPGADRGQGGSYLLVGPGYDGPLPEGGHYVRHSRTNYVVMLGRAFINENPGNDPAPTTNRIKDQLKVYPYTPGGVGSSIGAYMIGRGPLGALGAPAAPRFFEGTGLPTTTPATRSERLTRPARSHT